MADLTSIYHKQNLRDKIIQACVDLVEHLADDHKSIFTEYGFLDLLDSEGGTQPPKSKFIHKFEKGFVRFLQIRDFSSENTPTFIPVDKKNKLCTKEDILLGRYGASVGKILTGKEGAYNVACAKMIILDGKKLSAKYLFYLLHSSKIQNTLQGITRGAQAGFNKGDLGKIKIVLPDNNYQEKIVDILFKLDRHLVFKEEFEIKKAEKNNFLKSFSENILKKVYTIKLIDKIGFSFEESIDLITQLRQSILQEAVQGKLPLLSGEGENASELLKRIKAEKEKLIKQGKLKKEKPLPPISENEIPYQLPDGWVWCRLGDIGILSRGKSKHRPRNDRKLFADGKYPFVQTGDVSRAKTKNNLITTYTGTYNDIGLAQSKMQTKGTLCITIAANIAECGFLNFEACVPDSIVCFKALDDAIEKYVHFFILVSKDNLEAFAPSTAQKNINLGILTELIFPLPPLSEQKRIVEKVNQLMQHCNELEQQVQQSISYAQQLMQAVLREVFEGKGKKYSVPEQRLRMVAEK
jgi:type I restriction enzyme S subunit